MKVIGVMSGTSLDGMDLCCVLFQETSNGYQYKIEAAKTYKYPEKWIKSLREAYLWTKENVHDLDKEFSAYTNSIIKTFIEEFSLKDVDLISNHGHTIWHQPAKGITYQIGNLPLLKQGLTQTVVCNFRIQDVMLGGQGAPLVPIGDELLFSQYDYCLNLGGFSNISFKENNKRIAFDICPVNILLNYYTNKYFNKEYDKDGELAEVGQVSDHLFSALNSIDFYTKNYPKSLGIENVDALFKPIISSYQLKGEDILATLVEHMAYQISNVILYYKGRNVLITGGGAYNNFLIKRIMFYAKNINLTLPDNTTIEYKEALIFAFLGYLKVHNVNNVFSSVTGAKRDHSSGVIFL